MKKLVERLEELERVKVKFEKKEEEKEFKFTNKGCEKQYKFNCKIQDSLCDKVKVELKKHFKDGLPEKVEKIIKEGEKDIEEQNHQLKIQDEFGSRGLEDFIKEELARDSKEEKKLKALRKEKREKEETSRVKSYRSFGGSYRSVEDGFRRGDLSPSRKKFDDKFSGKDRVKDKDDMRCYNCERFGHYAKDCAESKSRRGK